MNADERWAEEERKYEELKKQYDADSTPLTPEQEAKLKEKSKELQEMLEKLGNPDTIGETMRFMAEQRKMSSQPQ